jgi:hypothetical protein
LQPSLPSPGSLPAPRWILPIHYTAFEHRQGETNMLGSTQVIKNDTNILLITPNKNRL